MKIEFQQFDDLSEIIDIEREAALKQPYLVAYFFKKVLETGEGVILEEGSIRNALNAVKLAFYHLTKTYGLVAVCHFLNDTEFTNGSEEISRNFAGMRIMYDSTCKDFLRKYYYGYKNVNRTSSFQNIMKAMEELVDNQSNYFTVMDKMKVMKKDAMSAAIFIRNNILGHLNREVDVMELWNQYWMYRECLAFTAKHLCFLNGITQSICYISDYNRENIVDSEIAMLHGCDKNLQKYTSLVDYLTFQNLKGCRLFHRNADGNVIGLEPFFSLLDSELDGNIDFEKDEYIAYEALGKDKAIFEGIRSFAMHKQYYLEIKELFKLKNVELILKLDKYNLPMLINFSVEATSQAYTDYYLDKKYCPDLYVERQELNNELEEFFASDETAFIFTGESGVGKSAFLANYANRFLNSTKIHNMNDVIELYDQKEVLFFINASSINNGEKLIDKIIDGLCLDNISFGSFLVKVDKIIYDSSIETRVVIMIDAVNEASRPEDVWKEIESMSLKGSKYKWLKIVSAIRDTGISRIVEKNKIQTINLDRKNSNSFITHPELFYRGNNESKNKEVLRLLNKFKGSELDEVLKKYLREYIPTSNNEFVKSLSNPLYLRIYRDLPKEKQNKMMLKIDLLDVWLDWLEYRSKTEIEVDYKTIKIRELISLFSELTFKNKDSLIAMNEFFDFDVNDKKQASLQNVNFYISALEHLILEGLIVKVGQNYQIKDQMIRGLCLARYLEPDFTNNPLKPKELVELAITYGDCIVDFPDAFAFLIKRRLDNENFNDIGDIWKEYLLLSNYDFMYKDKEWNASGILWSNVFRLIFIQARHKMRKEFTDAIKNTNEGSIVLCNLYKVLAIDEKNNHYEIAKELAEIVYLIIKEKYDQNKGNIYLSKDYASGCKDLAIILEEDDANLERVLELLEIAHKLNTELYEKHREMIDDIYTQYLYNCEELAKMLAFQGEEKSLKRSIELYEDSLILRKEQYEENREQIEFAKEYSFICNSLAGVIHKKADYYGGNLNYAIELYETALDVSKEMYEKHSDDINFAQNYASDINILALSKFKLGAGENIHSIIELIEIAYGIRKELFEHNRDRIDFAKDYNDSCYNLGTLIASSDKIGPDRGNLLRVFELLEEAYGISKKLYERHKSSFNLAQIYIRDCYGLAHFLLAHSEKNLNRVLELYSTSLEVSKEMYEKYKDIIDSAAIDYASRCYYIANKIKDLIKDEEISVITLYETSIGIYKELYVKNREWKFLAENFNSACNELAVTLESKDKRKNLLRVIELLELAHEISNDMYERYGKQFEYFIMHVKNCNKLAKYYEYRQGKDDIQNSVKIHKKLLKICKNQYEKYCRMPENRFVSLKIMADQEYELIRLLIEHETTPNWLKSIEISFSEHVKILKRDFPNDPDVEDLVNKHKNLKKTKK